MLLRCIEYLLECKCAHARVYTTSALKFIMFYAEHVSSFLTQLCCSKRHIFENRGSTKYLQLLLALHNNFQSETNHQDHC